MCCANIIIELYLLLPKFAHHAVVAWRGLARARRGAAHEARDDPAIGCVPGRASTRGRVRGRGGRVQVGRGRKVEQEIGESTRAGKGQSAPSHHRRGRVAHFLARNVQAKKEAIKHLLSEVDSTAELDNAGKRNPVAGCKRNPVTGVRKARTRRFILWQSARVFLAPLIVFKKNH